MKQGQKHTEESKKKMRAREFSKEHRKKLSDVHKGKPRPYCAGEKNWNWKGGNNSQYRIKNAPRPKPEQCEVCGALGKDFKKGLFLDHNHKTGEFRGWLCTRCNFILGLAKDNSETLRALANYLQPQTR